MNNRSKTACVVGASGGIGSAVVRRLRKEGWSQIIELDVDGPISIDLAKPDTIEAAFKKARGMSDHLDLLVIASGILDNGKLATLDLERWNHTLAVNLTGPFLCCQHCREWLSNCARIVMIGSLAGRTGGVLTGTAYAVSKGGMESLVKAVAQELAARRITVNCVTPGGVDTPMLASNTEEGQASLIAATPLKRLATADEIASLVAYLSDEDAAYITGAVLPMNGGLRMD